MKEMAILAWRAADAKSPTFQRWFAESDADNVKNVLARIVDMALQEPELQSRMKDRVLVRDDWGKQCGLGVNAYTDPKSGRHHFCPFGLQQPNAATMDCDDLAPSSENPEEKMSSRKSRTVSGTMLHEIVHWIEIGDAALGKHIIDIKGGSYDCFTLSAEDKLIKAQKYAFLATEAYFETKGCNFVDPEAGTTDVDDPDMYVDDLPSKGMSLSIAMTSSVSPSIDGAAVDNKWKFYTTSVGKAVGSCGETDGKELTPQGPSDPSLPSSVDIASPLWPAGIFNLTIEGEECQYKCDRTNAGRLFCPLREISCTEDSAKSTKDGMKQCGSSGFFHAAVYCDF